ncbi:hypothetical protein ABW21_db0204030 [Orbilia brochopaga]|nr:hypothetical protein ABW21_db0204030 [Drechslerella brochopaga]
MIGPELEAATRLSAAGGSMKLSKPGRFLISWRTLSNSSLSLARLLDLSFQFQDVVEAVALSRSPTSSSSRIRRNLFARDESSSSRLDISVRMSSKFPAIMPRESSRIAITSSGFLPVLRAAAAEKEGSPGARVMSHSLSAFPR